MLIQKRNGTQESYDQIKIITAIRKSFASTGKRIEEDTLYEMAQKVEDFLLTDENVRSVEKIQDEVERLLMKQGFYDEAKSYILYRWQRTEQRKNIEQMAKMAGDQHLTEIFKSIQQRFPTENYSMTLLAEKFNGFCKADMKKEERLSALIKAAVELTTQEAPDRVSPAKVPLPLIPSAIQ